MNTITIIFIIAGIFSLIATEIARSVIDKKRKEKTGVGGTQDIAIAGVLITGICVVGTIISWILWIF